MLEKLDGIDWKSLSHACGDASDILDLIRALISQDKTVRDDAYDCLYTTLFHQGARWAAYSYAIPFLYEILADKAAQDKAGLIAYILHLAVGYPD